MSYNIEKRFLRVYNPLRDQFLLSIKGINEANLPSPFLPHSGLKYEKSDLRVAFIGMDSSPDPRLAEFRLAKKSLFGWSDIISTDVPEEAPEFLDYRHVFWNFILKFLANLHGVDESKLRNSEYANEKVINDIWQSFAYGNVNSVLVSYPGLEKGKGVSLENWSKIKTASKIFDKADYFLSVFQPHVMIILHYNEQNFNWDWLPKDFESAYVDSLANDKIDYYYLSKSNTHVFWTYHPRSFAYQQIDANEIVRSILETLKNKNKCSSLSLSGLKK